MLICAMLVTGCVKTTAIGAIDVYCGSVRPITWSTRDTDQTIREVKANNAVYAKLCDKRGLR